jgi:hypothetical protein
MDTMHSERLGADRAWDSPEWEQIVRWRYERLRAAGFSDGLAGRLAVTRDVDLHALLALVDRGCPASLAARILGSDAADLDSA